ncbi:MAG: hypothetical protein HY698_22695, partial [Deltaproteobacteria bacterium]|nr:hypothetical protein [Deltaproteobacteria bacterium]
MRRATLALLAASAALILAVARADELSSSDKRRILYSQRFTFTREGLPLLTVELMRGQAKVHLSASPTLRVLPEGDGGPEVLAGSSWTITVENPRPAKMRYWTIVSRQATEE